jgi:hypothetical protein
MCVADFLWDVSRARDKLPPLTAYSAADILGDSGVAGRISR